MHAGTGTGRARRTIPCRARCSTCHAGVSSVVRVRRSWMGMGGPPAPERASGDEQRARSDAVRLPRRASRVRVRPGGSAFGQLSCSTQDTTHLHLTPRRDGPTLTVTVTARHAAPHCCTSRARHTTALSSHAPRTARDETSEYTRRHTAPRGAGGRDQHQDGSDATS